MPNTNKPGNAFGEAAWGRAVPGNNMILTTYDISAIYDP